MSRRDFTGWKIPLAEFGNWKKFSDGLPALRNKKRKPDDCSPGASKMRPLENDGCNGSLPSGICQLNCRVATRSSSSVAIADAFNQSRKNFLHALGERIAIILPCWLLSNWRSDLLLLGEGRWALLIAAKRPFVDNRQKRQLTPYSAYINVRMTPLRDGEVGAAGPRTMQHHPRR